MTEIFSSGWENSGGSDVTDDGAWTGSSGSPTVVGTPVHTGSYGLKAEVTVTGGCYVTKTLASSYAELYARFYVQVNAVTTQIRGFLQLNDEYGNSIGAVGVDSSRHLQLRYYNAGVQTATSTTILTLDQWYCVELYVYQSDTVGQFKVYLDGTEVNDLAQTNCDNYIASNLKILRVGMDYAWATSTIYADCTVVATTYIGVEGAPPEGQPYISRVQQVSGMQTFNPIHLLKFKPRKLI